MKTAIKYSGRAIFGKRVSFIFMCLLILTGINGLHAQKNGVAATHLLRGFEENDLYNLASKKTDRSYTNGVQIGLLYARQKPFQFFIDRLMPKAGDSAVTVAGWGLTQLIFTPENIAASYYQPGDYPYAGVLYINRSVYSYDPIKRYSFQTEWYAGVRGPAALAEETQKFIHRFVGVREPMGWRHQLTNKPFANLSFKIEKELAAYKDKFELIADGQVLTGTMVNGLAMGATIRWGKMTPYFNGILSHYTGGAKGGHKNDLQLYLFIKPAVIYNFYNGLLNGQIQVSDSSKTNYHFTPKKLNYSLNVGAVLAYKRCGISYSQNSSGVLLQGLNTHYVGNFSLYYSW